jgi:hypothetical protein
MYVPICTLAWNIHVYTSLNQYILVYTCTYTSVPCTDVYILPNVCTMYVPCTDVYVHIQTCMYISGNVQTFMYHVCDVSVLWHCTYASVLCTDASVHGYSKCIGFQMFVLVSIHQAARARPCHCARAIRSEVSFRSSMHRGL